MFEENEWWVNELWDVRITKNEIEELDKWNRPAVSSETISVKEAKSEQKIREWTAGDFFLVETEINKKKKNKEEH